MSEHIYRENQPQEWGNLSESEKEAEYVRATAILREQARKHIPPTRPNSMLRLIERPVGYRQDFSEIYFPPSETASIERLHNLSSMALGGSERFDALLKQVSVQSSEIEKAKQKILAGEVIGVITNHGELLDLAIALTTVTCAMNDPEIIKKNRIMVGPIVKELSIGGWETIDILNEGAGVFVGFPDTESTRTSGIHPGVIGTSNKSMPKRLFEQTREEGLGIYMAASGSTDEVIVEGGRVTQIRMKPASSATEAIADRWMDWVLPVVVSLHPGHMGARVGELQQLSAEYSLHDFMETQVAKLYREASGVQDITYLRPTETAERKFKRKKAAATLGPYAFGGPTSLQNHPG